MNQFYNLRYRYKLLLNGTVANKDYRTVPAHRIFIIHRYLVNVDKSIGTDGDNAEAELNYPVIPGQDG